MLSLGPNNEIVSGYFDAFNDDLRCLVDTFVLETDFIAVTLPAVLVLQETN